VLELPPDVESNLRDYAIREGVSVNELIARTFPARQASRTVPQSRPPVGDSGERRRVALHAVLALPKEEINRRNARSIAHLEAELADAVTATPAEVEAADIEWEEHKRRMNAHRAVTGERPLFADVETDLE